MALNKTHKMWLKQNVGDDLSPNTRFLLKIANRTPAGNVNSDFKFDLIWYIILYVKASDDIKIQVCESLLKDKDYLQNFQRTLDSRNVKRMIAEFLLFNQDYLIALKSYIVFEKLDEPVDFVSHILFLQPPKGISSSDDIDRRLMLVNLVLAHKFKLDPRAKAKDGGGAIYKVLNFDHHDSFKIAYKMLLSGFKLFGYNNIANFEVATKIISHRSDASCKKIIEYAREGLSKMQVAITANEKGNLCDYYYWIKEDMPAFKFLKSKLSIKLSKAT